MTNEKEILLNTAKRAGSTIVHEIGHIFGIKHGTYFHCKMNGSNSLKESVLRPA